MKTYPIPRLEEIYALSIKEGQDITTISADKNGGARENYDLLINTSGKDIEQVSEAVADFLKKCLFE